LPFFEDSFAGGTTNPANGFTYSNELGGLDSTTVVAAGGGNQVDSGFTHSLQTTFPGVARPGQTGSRQINFSLGRECDEFWMEWRVHIPSNYTHRNNYDPGPPVVPYTDNNKFITLYADTYSAGWHQPMCELNTDGATSDNPSDGRSYVRSVMRYATDGVLTDIPGGGQVLIGSGAPMTPGAWHTVRFYTKKETTRGALDGVWTLWVNGSVVTNLTGLAMGTNDGAKFPRGVEKGYLLGFANSGFTDATTFHTQWIKCYDTNPGW
jgi:hypothetical protein